MASRTILSDRFIPYQSSSNIASFHISGADNSTNAYAATLRSTLFGSESAGPNIFKFKTETRKPVESLFPINFDNINDQLSQVSLTKAPRKIPADPYDILDAPLLKHDFYADLIDWSPRNVLAVGLGSSVCLKPAFSGDGEMLCDLGGDVCSVSWAQSCSDHLAVGDSTGEVQIWDVSQRKRITSMKGHSDCVTTLAWSSICTTLSSGSRDKTVLNRDIRMRDGFVSKLTDHKGYVSGLKWSQDNEKLASGGNDNQLFVWNRHSTKPILKYSEHTAAVKAIAWSPHKQGLLASGGGENDGFIRFWNTDTDRDSKTSLSCMNTGSEVCKLAWSNNVNEIVSTHGYSKSRTHDNDIMVWEHPKMSKVATLKGHESRVVYLAVSPDGRRIVTGAGGREELLRFWNVFPKSSRSRKPENGFAALSLGMRSQIR